MKLVIKQGLTAKDKKTKEYHAWKNMINRCTLPTQKWFHRYGGRGIGVSAEWRLYKNFLRDMGNAPTQKLSLERINNNLGYSKENCCWATAVQQARNTEKTRKFTINGETKCLKDWANQYSINYITVIKRLQRNWDINSALKTQSGPTYERNKCV